MGEPLKLRLVQESKIWSLLPDVAPTDEFEASGLIIREGTYFVVFDSLTSVARISQDWNDTDSNGLFGDAPRDEGYEGITYNEYRDRYYLLVESRDHDSGGYQARITEFDESFRPVKSRPLDFTFESDNKGFEAVAHVRREDQDFVLALCEGNKCKKTGKRGGGRIQLFEQEGDQWSHVDAIKLPRSVRFRDYSGMAIDGHRVAISSQVDSKLWVGSFDEASWGWVDDGIVYEFPRAANGAICYGNIEGVAWLTRTRIATVSDRRKKKQSKWFRNKDQSIHVFDLP